LRLGACVFGLVQTAFFPWDKEMIAGAEYAPAASYALSAAIGLVGAGTLVALRADWPSTHRLAQATLALDALIVLGFTAEYSIEQFVRDTKHRQEVLGHLAAQLAEAGRTGPPVSISRPEAE
jgi:hypothetical protein